MNAVAERRTAFIRNPRLVGSTRSRLSTNLLFAKNHFRSGSIKQTKMRFYPIINRLLLLLFLFTQISIFGQHAHTLIGEVIDGKEKIPVTGATIRLLDSILTKTMIQYTVSDYDGVFTLTNIPSGSYKLQIVPVGYRDSIFTVIVNQDTSLRFDISRNCEYKSTLKQKTCPNCRREDKVIPIEYGLFIFKKERYKKLIGKKMILGGCMISDCQPLWYCKRDELKF